MRLVITLGMMLLVLLVTGCGSAPPSGEPGQPSAVEMPADPPVTRVDLDPEDPAVLKRPFTADEIRQEWVPGLTLEIMNKASGAEALVRWTVLSAGESEVEIEYTILDAEGNPTDKTQVDKTTWVALRDHASFPAEIATRDSVRRDTALGTLDGWLYTVTARDTGEVTEFFFARDLPGAPVEVRTMLGDEIVREMTQVARRHP